MSSRALTVTPVCWACEDSMVNAITAESELSASFFQPASVRWTQEFRFWLIDHSAVIFLLLSQVAAMPARSSVAVGGFSVGAAAVPSDVTRAACGGASAGGTCWGVWLAMDMFLLWYRSGSSG